MWGVLYPFLHGRHLWYVAQNAMSSFISGGILCGHNVRSVLTLLVICHDALTMYWDHSWTALVAFTLADPARY